MSRTLDDQLDEALALAETIGRQRDEALDGYQSCLRDYAKALDLCAHWRTEALSLREDLEFYKARAVLRAGELPPSQRPPIDPKPLIDENDPEFRRLIADTTTQE